MLSHQGKYDEAEQMARQAFELMEKVLGREDPDTLMSMDNVASVLEIQGKYDEAERIRRKYSS